MNLEELQIKVSLDLKDLNKQLKDVTKSINDTLGPQATKRMMVNTHKVIKNESRAINKTLNSAFEIDTRKLNRNITESMNQAKRTVRQACNDIRRELNNALNVRANIKVTASTSVRGSGISNNKGSDAAAILASSQYTAAMIVKAINAMIDTNNANTIKLEGAIKESTNRIVSAIKNIKIESVNVSNPSKTTKESKPTKTVKRKNDSQDQETKIAGLLTTSGINFELGKAGKQISEINKEYVKVWKFLNIIIRNMGNLTNLNNTPQLGTGSYGNNLPQVEHINFTLGEMGDLLDGVVINLRRFFKEIKSLGTSGINFDTVGGPKDSPIDVNELKKAIHSLRKGLYSDSRGFEMGDSTSEYHTGKVVNQKKSGSTKALETEEPLEVSFKVIDDELESQINEALSKIKQVSLPTDVFNFDTDEIVAKVRESNEHIKQAFKDRQDIIKQSKIPSLNAPTEDIEKATDEIKLVTQIIKEAVGVIEKVKSLGDYFNSSSMDIAKARKEANKLCESIANIRDASEKLEGRDLSGLKFEDRATGEVKSFVDTLEEARGLIKEIVDYKPVAPIISEPVIDLNKKPEAPFIEEEVIEIEVKVDEPQVKKELSKLEQIAEQSKKRLADMINVQVDPNNLLGSYKTGKFLAGFEKVESSKTKEQLDMLREALSKVNELADVTISELSNIDNTALEQMNASLRDWAPMLEQALDSLKDFENRRIKINADTTDAQRQIEALKATYETLLEACNTNDLRKIRELLPKDEEAQTQTKSNKGPARPPRVNDKGLEKYTSDVEKISSRLDDVAEDLMEVVRVLDSIDDSMSKNDIGHLKQCEETLRQLSQTDLSHLNRDITSLAKSFSGADFDTSDIDKLINRLKALKEIRSKLSAINKNAQKIGQVDDVALSTQFKALKDYKNVSFGKADGDTLNFLPYKIELDKIAEYAKKTGSKIKKALSGAFSGIKGAGKNFFNNFDSHVAVHQAGEIKEKLNEIKDKYKKTSKEIDKIANKLVAPFKKITSALKGVASKTKTAWDKITGVFKKGANEASRATEKLTSSLDELLDQALSFASLFALISLGKEAIEQSKTLAQAEVKLASLMKQRMGATNNTILAVRQLAEEQAKLGVVSETAMKHGAQQLAMYIHSAKALETLMPAIGNLTAKRGGLFATEDDAEEVATQLGEAIREGTTTPLEQSGIYLSEKEIEKFAQLSTEEERAAYLANVIAKNVGNLNQQLANTPHGAIAQLKNNFQSLLGTLGIFLANVIKPIVQGLNVIVVACNNALKALGKLLGFDMTGGATSVPDLGTGTTPDTGGIDDTKESFDEAKDSIDKATEANEKFKGSLMGFDELNILTDNTNKNSDSGSDDFDPTDITPGTGGQLIPDVGELTEADSIFSKFGEKIKAFMSEILEPFSKAWDLLGDRWIQAWNDLLDSFKNFCDSLATFLKSVWDNGGKEFVQHIAEICYALDIAAMEIGGTILDALAELWRHLDPETNMNTQGFLNALNEVSVKLRDFILDLNGHLESLLEHGGQDVLNAMGDCFMNLGEAAVRGFGVVIDAVDGLLDHLDPATNEITSNMLKSWEDAFHAIGNCALEFTKLLESTLDNGGQDLINAIGDLAMQIGATLGTLVEEVANCMSEFFKYMDPGENEIARGAIDAFKYFVDSIRNFVEMLGNALGTFMDNGGQEFVNNMGDIIALLLDIAATVTGDLINAITAFMDSWAGHMVISTCATALELISEVLKGLLEIIEPLTPVISGVVAAIGGFLVAQKVVGFISGIVTVFQTLAGSGGILALVKAGFTALWTVMAANPVAAVVAVIVGIGTALVALYNQCEGFREFVDNILEGFEGLFEAIKEHFSKLLEDVRNIFGNVIDIITGIFEGDGEKVGEAVRNLIFNILDLIYDLNQSFIDIGWELIEGLVKGVWECVKALPSLLAGLGEFILDFFAGLFGIDGDKFVDMGKDLIKGFADGVSGAIDGVTNAFTKVKDAVMGPIEDTVEKSLEGWRLLTTDTEETLSVMWDKVKDSFAKGFEYISSTVEEKWNGITEFFSEKFGNVSDAIGEQWSGIKNSFSEGCENVSNTVGGWVDTISEKWSSITEPISNNLSVAIENASVKFGELKEELTGILDDFIERNKERWERIKADTSEKIGPIVDDVIEKYTNMKDSTSESLDELMKASEEAWAKVKEAIMGKLDPVIDYVSGVWTRTKEACIDAWNEIETACSESWNRVKDECIEIWNGIEEFFIGVWDRTKEAWLDAWDDIETACTEAWDRFSEECIKTWNKTKEECIAIWDRTKEAWVGAWEDIETACSESWNRVKDEFTKIWDSVVDYASGVWDRTKEAWLGAWDDIKTECAEAWDRVKNEFTKTWDSVVDYASGVWNRTADAWIDAWEDIERECTEVWNRVSEECIKTWNKVKDECIAIWDRTKEACVGAWEDVTKSCTESWNRVSEECSEVWGNVKDAIIEAMSGITDFFNDLWEDIKDIFGSMAEDIVEFVGPKWDTVVEFFEEIGTKIYEAISGILLVIPGMLKDLFNVDIFEPIKEGLESGLEMLKQGGDLFEKAYSVGQFIIEGLCDGIMTTIEFIGTLLEGIGDIVIGFFKDLFGIHSPSTVFAELGVYLIEGLIKGIEDTIKSVSDAFEKVKDAAIKVVEKITTEVGKKWDEINKDINKKLTDLKKDISNKWNEIKKTTKERCTEIWEATKEQYGKLKDTVSTSIDKVKEVSSDKWNDIKDKTADIVGKTKEKIEEKYNKLKDNLISTMDKWRTNSEEKWNKVKDKTSEVIGKIVSDTEKKYSDIKDTLGKKVDEWKESSSKKWTEIKTNTTDIIEKLRTESEDKFNTIKEKLTNKLEEFRTNSSNKWEEVKKNTTDVIENIKSDAEDKFNKLKEAVGSKIEEIVSNSKTKWEDFKTTTASKVSEAVDTATTEYGKIKEKFTKKMDEAKTALGKSWDTIKSSTKTWASQLPDKVTEGLSNLKSKMTKPFEDAKKSIETVISNIGRAFKNANWEMPKIKMPHLKVTGEWSFNPPKVPKFSIEWYKRGGIIDGITPLGFANGALQMGGEAGKEMVVPLEDTSFTSKIAQAMGQAVDNALARQSTSNNSYSSGYNVIDDKRDIVLKINDREFARASINSINKLQRESGRTLLDI